MPCMQQQTLSIWEGVSKMRSLCLRHVHGIQLLDGWSMTEREPRRGGQKCAVLSLISQKFDLLAT